MKVFDPAHVEIYSGKVEESGEFRFTSHVGGEYKVCIVVQNTYYSVPVTPLRFHLHLETGDKAINYDEVAKKEQLGELEITVRKLNDKVTYIQSLYIHHLYGIIHASVINHVDNSGTERTTVPERACR